MHDLRLSLLVDGLELPAALTVPARSFAALLLVPGSVNSDVDGNYAPMFPGQPAMNPHAYKDLAEQLAARGVAVLRFSKSGPGTGAVVRDPALAKAKYGQFSQRLRVAEVFLDELARRVPGVPLAVAGHSEGAVVATLLAEARPELRALVLLSGPAKPLLQLMIWQGFEAAHRNGTGDEHAYRQAMGAAADYAAGRPISADLAGNPYVGMVPFFLQPEHVSYLRSLEQVDPAAELARISQPTLLIQGGRDLSVIAENADLLHRANPRAEVVRVPELQHFYKRAPEGISAPESMALAEESDPAVAEAMAQWLVQTLGARVDANGNET